MTSPRKIGEHVDFGSWKEVRAALGNLAKKYGLLCSWTSTHSLRTNVTVAFFNLLDAARVNIELVHHDPTAPLSIVALSTRNIFEIDIRARHLLLSNTNLQQWQSESVVDNLQVLEGLIESYSGEAAPEIQVLRDEAERLRAVALRHGMSDSVKILSVSDLAKAVGLQSEYRALFKLYSKLVHPSAYLVNRSASDAHGPALRNILLIMLQVYGHDLLERVRVRLRAPRDVLEDGDA